MKEGVQSALQRAAERAKRVAELDGAGEPQVDANVHEEEEANRWGPLNTIPDVFFYHWAM